MADAAWRGMGTKTVGEYSDSEKQQTAIDDGGSKRIGLAGDYTPPSRSIRVVAWSQTARLLEKSSETVYELFRILDNFNVPLGTAEGSDSEETNLKGMRTSTLWTSAWDLSMKVLYFHTQSGGIYTRPLLPQGLTFFSIISSPPDLEAGYA